MKFSFWIGRLLIAVDGWRLRIFWDKHYHRY